MNTDGSEDLQSQYILYHATISYLASMIFCGTIFNTIALKNAVRVRDMKSIRLYFYFDILKYYSKFLKIFT